MATFAVQMNMAGQAIEVLALTADQMLLATLREAMGEQQRIWHANTPEQAVELIMAGHVGVVLADTLVTGADTASFCERLRMQFPDLVLVVAGSTEDQTQLVKHITSGDVYRFLHKPVSAARARQFIEASLRRRLDGRAFTPPEPQADSAAPSPIIKIGGIAIAVVVAVIAAFAIFSGGKDKQTKPPAPSIPAQTSAPAATPLPTPDDAAQSATMTAPASSAESMEPSVKNASEADRLLKQAEAALLAGQLNEAAAHIEAVRRLDANHTGLAFLSAQVEKEQDRQKRSDRIGALLKQASKHLRAGRLVEPDGENARASVEAALAQDPGNAQAQQILQTLTEELVAKVRESIAGNDFTAADRWLNHARELKTSPTLIGAVQNELQTARTEFTRKEDAEKARVAAEKEAADRRSAAERERQAFLTNVVSAASIPRNKQVQPEYPSAALRKGIEGWVDLDFTVAIDGKVKDIETRGAQPEGVFEQAARTAIAQWRFKPVMKDGRAVEQRARVRLRFAVDK